MPDFATLLLHLDGSPRMDIRARVARELAQVFGARVRGQYCVTPSLLRYPFVAEGAGLAVGALATRDEECRARVRVAFEAARCGSSLLAWSDARTDGFESFIREAVYADLVILGQRRADDPAADETPADLVPWLLLESGRPALLIPWAGEVTSVGRRVLVGWKPTREAARALNAALPWLRSAERVHVACSAAERERVLAFLGAHGIAAAAVSAGEEAAAGDGLLSLAADMDADLLVMGAYGHSRTREWVLGGATRTVLQSMTLPVLMVH